MLAKAEVENAYNTALECLRRSRSLRTLRQGGHFRMVTARYRANGHVEWLPERLYGPDIDTSQPAPRQKLRGLAPHVALSMLHAGHRRFLSPVRAAGDISPKRRAQLAKSEQSIAVVVTCSDSRVVPEHIFDAGLGELYVVRVAGNVFSDAVQASIEHAVANTGASICVVLGHEKCGMVAAAIKHAHDDRLSPSMRRLVQKIAPAVEIARHRVRNRENLPAQAVRVHAQRLVAQLRSGSRFLRGLEKEGRLSMLPAVYELDTGDIHWLKDGGASGDRALLVPATPIIPAIPPTAAAPWTTAAPTVSAAPIGPPPPEVLPDAPALPAMEIRPEPQLYHPSKASEPKAATPLDPEKDRRNRALLLTIMAAAMVAFAGLLLVLLWQRRNIAYVPDQAQAEGHADDYDEYASAEYPQDRRRDY